MNSIRLLKYLYSKRLIGEVVLLIQLVLMLVCAFSALNPIDAYIDKRQALTDSYVIDLSRVLHFSAGYELLQQERLGAEGMTNSLIEKKIASVSEIDTVMKFQRLGASYKNGQIVTDEDHLHEAVANAEFIIYGKECLDYIELEMSEGVPVEGAKDAIPIVVTHSLKSEFPIGSIKKIRLSDGNIYNCFVTGVLDKKVAIPLANSYGSNPTIEALGIFPWLEMEGDYIIAVDNGNMDITWGYTYLLIPDINTDTEELKNILNNKLGNLGTIGTASQIMSQSFWSMMHENEWYIVLFSLLCMIALFGYGGYVYMMICHKRKEFSILYLLGITKKKIVLMIFGAGLSVLTFAFFLSVIIAPSFISDVLHIKQVSSGVFGYLFCLIILVLILSISTILGLSQVSKTEMLLTYKGGD